MFRNYCLVKKSCSTLFVTPRTVVHQDPLDFPGKNARTGCHFLLYGDLPDREIKPASLAWAGGFLTAKPPGKSSESVGE